jgi:hypothetical protein
MPVQSLPEWLPESLLWLGFAILLAALAAALGAWAVVRRLEELRAELASLEELSGIRRQLESGLAEREGLDLRRIEHLLIDLRDAGRRLEELFLRSHEARAETGAELVPAGAPLLAERVVQRLVTLGYERVEIVTPHEELERCARGDGEVRVEARREGLLCKGRVRVRAGRIEGAHLEPALAAFP